MRGSPAILLDGSRSSWPDFVDWLYEFRMATDEAGLFAYLRAPRDREGDARRLVRDLAMCGVLQVIAADAPVPRGCVVWAVIDRAAASASGAAPAAQPLAMAG